MILTITLVTGLEIPAKMTRMIWIAILILMVVVVPVTSGVVMVFTVTSGGSALFAPEKCDT